MNKEVTSCVEIETNLENTSIAMNGLLNLDDNVNKVVTQYDLNVKEDKLIKKTKEPNLKYFYKTITGINLRLSSMSETETKLDYVLLYNAKRQIIIVGIYTVIVMLAFALPFFLLFIEKPMAIQDSQLDMIWILLLISFMLLLVPIWAIVLFQNRKKYKDRLFHKFFLPRLEKYIEIVEGHKKA
ncbi:hypothetical protein M2475_002051 [Breznakia sp. PF5-3]|uniref:hypothetical protein n=1 Tax=unclassified Breznakia TaxID=2623764 RepID=UPI0024068B05|nr:MULTISPECIES: hypothetical protein [unclassified Breznakia]MDF9825456.1 hypothetical protein [Breznakia sp. PM6-1]MDF9836470.1 hypothetical protein [Breznakia sp. PF5-3]MDF9838498.1 hypothetical protein [Breznakia sp. PFB2-8]MDF9860616.1 hypothetical protein [Breznakia sp. PH5-24]